MEYAQALDAPFAYSSNGDAFVEHDFLTGQEREFPLDEFPTEAELTARYFAEKGFSPDQERVANQAYYEGMKLGDKEARYYQRVAINRTVDAIAGGQDRAARDDDRTGKTYGVQIV